MFQLLTESDSQWRYNVISGRKVLLPPVLEAFQLLVVAIEQFAT